MDLKNQKFSFDEFILENSYLTLNIAKTESGIMKLKHLPHLNGLIGIFQLTIWILPETLFQYL
jgi:hypothetical protein